MIERYTLPRMAAIWSLEHRYGLWLKVELAVCEALAGRGLIPEQDWQIIRKRACVDVERIADLEKVTNHEVVAFVRSVAEKVGPAGRHIHHGLTSSDVMDTALALQLVEAGVSLRERLEGLRRAVGRKALAYKDLPVVGRTHGVHAEPMTFGLKLGLWWEELGRHQDRLERAVGEVGAGKLSGAVGTYAHMPPDIEEEVCAKLGLTAAPISSQIVPRDRHAQFLCALALIASSLDKFALEIRSLQRTEVGEAEEPFRTGQTGSSAMPHKRNPIMCERVSGLARVVRANALVGLENVALWHERDISHSSAERVALPDSTSALDYLLHIFERVVTDMAVYPEAMQRNLYATRGLVFSESVLLALVEAGMERHEAYRKVQGAAKECWQTGLELRVVLQRDDEVAALLGPEGLAACFGLERHVAHVDRIYRRLGLGS
jgi:adenylosuccinate lyase